MAVAGEIQLENYLLPAEVGPSASPNFDWWPVWLRVPELNAYGNGVPVCVRFGARQYYFTHTLRCVRGVRLVGVAGWGKVFATKLLFPPGVPGIRIEFDSIDPATGLAIDGRGSSVERLWVAGDPKTTTVADGITMLGTAGVINCRVSDFTGCGVHVIGLGINATPRSGSDLWNLTEVRVDGCKSHGLFVEGQDANQGVAYHCDFSNNAGWGVLDSSFLGNKYDACHFSNNAGGAAKTTNGNQYGMFDTCYAEQNQPKAEIRPPVQIHGGLLGKWQALPVCSIQSDTVGIAEYFAGAKANNELDPANKVFAQLGSANLGATWFSFGIIGNSQYWRGRYDQIPGTGGGWAYFNFAASGIGTPWRFCDSGAPEWFQAQQGAKTWIENGYFLGKPTVRVGFDTGTAPPTTGTADGKSWPKGWFRWNSNPDPTEPIGWFCVVGSTVARPKGTWAPVGAIGAALP